MNILGKGAGGKKKASAAKIGSKLLIIMGALSIGAGATYVVNASQYSNKFIEGTYINGMDASDKSAEEVESMIAPEIDTYSLTVSFRDGSKKELKAADVDLSYTPDSQVKDLLSSQNNFAWLSGALGSSKSYNVNTPVSFDADKLKSIVLAWPEAVEEQMVAPINAHMRIADDGSIKIVQETPGTTINDDALLKEIESALSEGKTTIDANAVEGIYVNPTVYSDHPDLNEQVEGLNSFLNQTVTYTLSDGSQKVLDRTTVSAWLTETAPGSQWYYVNPDNLKQQCVDYMSQIAAEDDNYGNYRTFKSTNYGRVRIPTSALHGHEIDQAAMAEDLYNTLMAGNGGTKEMTYANYEDTKRDDLGGTYIEVDVSSQMVYVYIDGSLYYQTSCVTGKEYRSPTPTGIYSIYTKMKHTNLTGAMRADGTPSYVSYVNYWMPFYGGYGLHDASWRSSFGGSIYKYSGSHGCVNLPNSAAATIYSACSTGTPVVVFRG